MKRSIFFFLLIALSVLLAPPAEAVDSHDYLGTNTINTLSQPGPDYAGSITTDSSGNIFIAGEFSGTVDFDPSTGTDNHTATGGYDTFLTKISSDGTYAWTKTMGGADGDSSAESIKLDADGNIFLAGDFTGTADFNPSGVTEDNRTSSGLWDMFLTKINADGTYAWTRTMGATINDEAYAMAIDLSGNIFITGDFHGTVDFDPSGTPDGHTSEGSYDIFLTKINADGSYGWTKTMGSAGGDSGWVLTTDTNGNIFMGGYFANTVDFNPTGTADNHTSVGFEDIFLTKINADGTYGWTKTVGGTEGDYIEGVTTDTDGNIFLAGIFNDTVDFDPSGLTDNHTSGVGFVDSFLTKIKADGTYGWTKTIGSAEGNDFAWGVATDSIGDIFVVGGFSNTVDFNPTGTADNHTSAGGFDIYLTKINTDGSYGWTKTMGAASDDHAEAITIDSSDNVFITGEFANTVDFNPMGTADNHTSIGPNDIFLTKFSPSTTAPVTLASPAGGTYAGYAGVVLFCDGGEGPGCANTYYTTDGSEPNTASDTYTDGILISYDTTLKFFSVDHDFNEETVVTEVYQITPAAYATPPGGTFDTNPVFVGIHCKHDGLCMDTYYTTDGSEPTMASNWYDGTISIFYDTTLKFFTIDGSPVPGPVITEVYTFETDAPTTAASPVGGFYESFPIDVLLTCDDGVGSGCFDTFYTTDGSEPSDLSTLYSSTIIIEYDTTLKFYSTDNVLNEEDVQTEVYTLGTPPPAINSVVINNDDAAVNRRAVTLQITCDGDCVDMRITNDNVNWTEWQAFNAAIDYWTVEWGNGTKTVTVEIRDSVSAVTSHSDTITLKDTSFGGIGGLLLMN